MPAGRLKAGDFLGSIGATDLVHFVVNVGDGDTQLLLLPEEEGSRKAIVVDVAAADKLAKLIEALQDAKVLGSGADVLALVVATHRHADHISGMAKNRAPQPPHLHRPGALDPLVSGTGRMLRRPGRRTASQR